MKNKHLIRVIAAAVLLSSAALFWYFAPSDVSIAGINAQTELVIGQLGTFNVTLQNNASKDVNVTINVKNSFVDAKGVSLKGVWVVAYGNLNYSSQNESDATDTSQKEVTLKPGTNWISYMMGYEVPGPQKVEVELYQYGKLIDSRSIEIDIPEPKILLDVQNHKGINGTDEIYTVHGNLLVTGKGSAQGVVVNISVINKLTNSTVSTSTRKYSLHPLDYAYYSSEPMVDWRIGKDIYDPVTGTRTSTDTHIFAPIVVIELSRGEPSDEKYILSPVVVKGRVGDRYKVIVTASWREQVISSEMEIPSLPAVEKNVGESVAEAQANVSFKIKQPAYIPEGYGMNPGRTLATSFYGSSSGLEQVMIFYEKGNEYLDMQELLVRGPDAEISDSGMPWKFVDINGVQGRFLEERSGVKYLSWKMGNVNFMISSYVYKENGSVDGSGLAGSSLSREDMIRIAGSVR